MRVGINGMGRIGRLALRAAMGGVFRDDNDPRGSNRLDIAHVNELKGGAAATAHLLEFDSIHGRWREQIGYRGRQRPPHRQTGASASPPPPRRGDVPWGDLGCDIVLECTGKFLKPDQLQGYFDRGVKRVIVAAPVKDPAGAERRGRRQRRPLRPGEPPAADRGLLHDQLPGAGRQSGPRGDRHPARPDHDDP